MFKSSFSKKMFGIFGAFLMTFHSFAWGPWGKMTPVRAKYFPEINKKTYRDPLLPYIYPEKKISPGEFRLFLEKLSTEQRKELYKALGKETNANVTADMLEKQILWLSSSWLTGPFKDLDYHETVRWTAKKIGIHPAECEVGSTFQLERKILEKLFSQVWDKMTPEQKEKVLKEAGLEPSQIPGIVALTSAGVIAAAGTTAALMGFGFYIIVAKTLVVWAAAVGVTAATTVSAVSLLCGPIGWCVAGIAAVGGLVLLGGANVHKTAAAIIAIHAIKATALTKSGIDVTQYLK